MWLRRIAILFGLFCGAAGTQAPEFAQQYRQRLGGTIDEIGRVLSNFDADSAAQGLDRAGGIARLEDNPDVFVKQRGAEIVHLQTRETRLSRQLQDMRRAGPVGGLVVLARDFDPGVAAGAARNFTPAIPVTPESAVCGLVSFLLGLGLLHGLAWPVRRRRRTAGRDDPARAQ